MAAKNFGKKTGFGPYLKGLREANGLSQQSLALAVNKYQSDIKDMEYGRIVRPGDDVVYSLADALNEDSDELFSMLEQLPRELEKKLPGNDEILKIIRGYIRVKELGVLDATDQSVISRFIQASLEIETSEDPA